MARGLTVILGLTILAGCGRSPVLDSASLEAGIASKLVPDSPEAVTDVVCPDVIAEGPTTTTCTATIGGVSIDVAVTISADDDAAISTDAVVIEVAEMEAAAAERLSVDLALETTIVCPGPPVIVSVPGATLRCDAIDPAGQTHGVIFTVRTDTGDWELSLDP